MQTSHIILEVLQKLVLLHGTQLAPVSWLRSSFTASWGASSFLLRCQQLGGLSAGQVKSIPALPASFIQAEFQVPVNLKPFSLHHHPAEYSNWAFPLLSLVLCRLGVISFPGRLNFASRSRLLLFLVFLMFHTDHSRSFLHNSFYYSILHCLYLDL